MNSSGIELYTPLGVRTADVAWDRVMAYRPGLDKNSGAQWVVQTDDGEIELPEVRDPHLLQRSILSHLPAGTLKPGPKHRRPSSKPQTEEIHLARHQSSSDHARFVLHLFLCIFPIGVIAITCDKLLDRRAPIEPLSGFGMGLLIVAAIIVMRTLFHRAKQSLVGRRIEMTPVGIRIVEKGIEQSMEWNDVVLVERQFLRGWDREAFYLFISDGKCNLLYREDWGHGDALLRYASEKTPAGTVFAGFDR